MTAARRIAAPPALLLVAAALAGLGGAGLGAAAPALAQTALPVTGSSQTQPAAHAMLPAAPPAGGPSGVTLPVQAAPTTHGPAPAAPLVAVPTTAPLSAPAIPSQVPSADHSPATPSLAVPAAGGQANPAVAASPGPAVAPQAGAPQAGGGAAGGVGQAVQPSPIAGLPPLPPQEDHVRTFEDMPVAVLGALDKVTARVTSLVVPVGKTGHFGRLSITVHTCRKAPPIEEPEAAAFLEITESRPDDDASSPPPTPAPPSPIPVFNGWMFASSPALSAMQSPIYDIWVMDCAKTVAEAAKR